VVGELPRFGPSRAEKRPAAHFYAQKDRRAASFVPPQRLRLAAARHDAPPEDDQPAECRSGRPLSANAEPAIILLAAAPAADAIWRKTRESVILSRFPAGGPPALQVSDLCFRIDLKSKKCPK
jgi:hypothetical protein